MKQHKLHGVTHPGCLLLGRCGDQEIRSKSGAYPVAVGVESVPFRSDPVTGKLGRRGTGAGETCLKTRARMSAMIEPPGHRGCGEGREYRDSEKFGRVGFCRRFFVVREAHEEIFKPDHGGAAGARRIAGFGRTNGKGAVGRETHRGGTGGRARPAGKAVLPGRKTGVFCGTTAESGVFTGGDGLYSGYEGL